MLVRRNGATDRFQQLRNEMDRLFDGYFGAAPLATAGLLRSAPSFPAVNVWEDQDNVFVEAELPGVDPKVIELTVSGNLLILSGEKKESKEETGGTLFRSERRYGAFRRSIELPSSADTERVSAEHKHGVLTVRIPRSESSKAKHIRVTAG